MLTLAQSTSFLDGRLPEVERPKSAIFELAQSGSRSLAIVTRPSRCLTCLALSDTLSDQPLSINRQPFPSTSGRLIRID